MTITEMKRLAVRFDQDKKQLRKLVENRLKPTQEMLDGFLEDNEHKKGNFKGQRVSAMFEANMMKKYIDGFLKDIEDFEEMMTRHQKAYPRSKS